MNKVLINKPVPMDIQQIRDVLRITLTDTFTKESDEDCDDEIRSEIEEKIGYLKECLESNYKMPYFLVVKDQEKIVGILSYGKCNDMIIKGSNGKYKDIGEIGTAYVLPKYQNKGILTQLLNSMYLHLMRINTYEFVLDCGFRRSQKIWRKKFGEPNIIMEDYWGKGSHHMIWHVNLKDIINS